MKLVETKEEMENALITGSLYRTVGSTQMNLESSRSHAIFSILIKQTNKNSILHKNIFIFYL